MKESWLIHSSCENTVNSQTCLSMNECFGGRKMKWLIINHDTITILKMASKSSTKLPNPSETEQQGHWAEGHKATMLKVTVWGHSAFIYPHDSSFETQRYFFLTTVNYSHHHTVPVPRGKLPPWPGSPVETQFLMKLTGCTWLLGNDIYWGSPEFPERKTTIYKMYVIAGHCQGLFLDTGHLEVTFSKF